MADSNKSLSIEEPTNCVSYSSEPQSKTQCEKDLTNIVASTKDVSTEKVIQQKSSNTISSPSTIINTKQLDTNTPKIQLSPQVSLKAKKTIQKKVSSSPKQTRCGVCRKRLGHLGFDCRCGKIFCASHRYFDKHDCDYDFLSSAKEKLIQENPLVLANKLEKI
mmetsp:Transcript_9303/g.15847  ORF Transcript_9303/g.15847 Transcript_9303/m.15847 type:complete len:163 (+) Transcript_9303:333-821(+)